MNTDPQDIPATTGRLSRWKKLTLAVNVVFLALLFASIVPVLYLGHRDSPQRRQKIELRFMYWGGPEQIMQERDIADAFARHLKQIGREDIEVKLIAASMRYHTKLSAMMSARQTPDVFMIAPGSIPKYVDRDRPLIVDITDRVAAERDAPDLQFDDLLPEAVKAFYCNGRLWGFPRDYKTTGVAYNADMLAAKGLEDPNVLWQRNEWTWEKFREYIVALDDQYDCDGQQKHVFGWFQDNFNEGYWHNILLQAGGGIWSDDSKELIIDRPESIRGLQFVYDLAWRNQPEIDRPCAKPWTPEMGSDDPWVARETAMMGFRGWHVPQYFKKTWDKNTRQFKYAWDVAPWPLGPELTDDPQPVRDRGGRLKGWRLVSGRVVLPGAVVWTSGVEGKAPFRLKQCTATGIGYCMSVDTKHPDEAWILLKFLVGPEAQRIRAGYQLDMAGKLRPGEKAEDFLIAGANMPSRQSLVTSAYTNLARSRRLRPTFTGTLAHKNDQQYWPRVDVFIEARDYGRTSTGSLPQDEISRELDAQFQRMLLNPEVTPQEVARETRKRADKVFQRLCDPDREFCNSYNTPSLVRPADDDPLGLAP